jgi:DNA repair protein RadD
VRKIPRWYQREAVTALHSYWERQPAGNPVIELPTGAGKSLLLGMIAKWLIGDCGLAGAVITHRAELLEQDRADILAYWPQAPVGLYSASLKSRRVTQLTLAGVQSICRKPEVLGRLDFVLVDEAHLVSPKSGTQYHRTIEHLRNKNPALVVIGLTATPYRQGQGLITEGEDKLFDSIVYRAPIRRLVDDGFLSPLVSAHAGALIDTSKAATSMGDFALADLALAADVDSITQTVADDVARELKGGRTRCLAYAVNLQHAANVRNALRFAGVSADLVTGEMDARQRRDLYDAFARGEVQCLVSCDVLTTGFNEPRVDLLAVVRPTKSTSLHVQILGRGMRVANGKVNCAVLDYGGNIARHGPIDDVRIKPKNTKGEGEAPVKVCLECGAECATACRVCPHCDAAFPEVVRKSNAKASALPPMLRGVEGASLVREGLYTVPVYRVVARPHVKPGRPSSLRIDYYGERKKIATEFVCLEHVGKAHEVATWWWRKNMPGTAQPETVTQALATIGDCQPIAGVNVKEDGEWLRVTSRVYGVTGVKTEVAEAFAPRSSEPPPQPPPVDLNEPLTEPIYWGDGTDDAIF